MNMSEYRLLMASACLEHCFCLLASLSWFQALHNLLRSKCSFFFAPNSAFCLNFFVPKESYLVLLVVCIFSFLVYIFMVLKRPYYFWEVELHFPPPSHITSFAILCYYFVLFLLLYNLIWLSAVLVWLFRSKIQTFRFREILDRNYVPGAAALGTGAPGAWILWNNILSSICSRIII